MNQRKGHIKQQFLRKLIVSDGKKKNCREFFRCGRYIGGANVTEFGVCPVFHDAYSGLNRGEKGGRICWTVSGTLCFNKRQGTYSMKMRQCGRCLFYGKVKKEEKDFVEFLPYSVFRQIVE